MSLSQMYLFLILAEDQKMSLSQRNSFLILTEDGKMYIPKTLFPFHRLTENDKMSVRNVPFPNKCKKMRNIPLSQMYHFLILVDDEKMPLSQMYHFLILAEDEQMSLSKTYCFLILAVDLKMPIPKVPFI